VNIERSSGAEVDVCATLEFFNFQRGISFPEAWNFSGSNDRGRSCPFGWRTIKKEQEAVKVMSSQKRSPRLSAKIPRD